MNLSDIAEGAISIVNPTAVVSVWQSDGTYTTDTDGTRTPNYTKFDGVPAQIQPLSNEELRMMDGLNIQGNRQAIYLDGNWTGLVRSAGKGGDLIIDEAGDVWLVVITLESWTDWTRAAIVLQNRK